MHETGECSRSSFGATARTKLLRPRAHRFSMGKSVHCVPSSVISMLARTARFMDHAFGAVPKSLENLIFAHSLRPWRAFLWQRPSICAPRKIPSGVCDLVYCGAGCLGPSRGGLDLGLFRKSNRPSGKGGLDLGLSKRANPCTRCVWGGGVQSDVRAKRVRRARVQRGLRRLLTIF